MQNLLVDVNNNPRYQNAIRRYMQLSPEIKAVFDSGEVTEAIGDEAFSKELKLIKLGADKAAFDSALAEKKRQTDLNYGLDKEKLQLYKNYRDEAASKAELARLTGEVAREKRSWQPLQHALGLGSLGVAGFTAYNKQSLLNTLAENNPDLLLKYMF